MHGVGTHYLYRYAHYYRLSRELAYLYLETTIVLERDYCIDY
jgi:hypothetical protein